MWGILCLFLDGVSYRHFSLGRNKRKLGYLSSRFTIWRDILSIITSRRLIVRTGSGLTRAAGSHDGVAHEFQLSECLDQVLL